MTSKSEILTINDYPNGQILKTDYYPNGDKRFEDSIVEINGEKLIKSVIWFENGAKLSEDFTAEHTPEILYQVKQTTWLETGVVADTYLIQKPYKPEYEIGDTIGYHKISHSYDNGQLKSETNYKEIFTDIAWGNEDDPALVESMKTYPQKKWINHGKNTEWYENGKVKDQSFYVDDEIDGVSTGWYESGQKLDETNTKNGLNHGKWTSWYEDGQKCNESTYINGSREGKWTHWMIDGQIDSEDFFKDDKLEGRCRTWYKNGQIDLDVNWKNGMRDGKYTRWYKNGEIEWSGEYKNGEIVKNFKI